jgi:hypothetical protein
LDRRAQAERKTMAQLIRDAVDRYLADDLTGDERERALAHSFGAVPGFGARVPARDEWDRS